ncbi:MAG: 2TM domain-containing protein [Dehalococcoidales bacterium]
MKTKPTQEEIYQRAKRRVDDKKSFYAHLAAYLVFNIVFVIIWAVTSPGGYAWFIWPLGGWTVAIVFHALGTFVFHKDSKWEQESVEKEAAKIKKLMEQEK